MIHQFLKRKKIQIKVECLIKQCLSFIMLLEMADLVRYGWLRNLEQRNSMQ